MRDDWLRTWEYEMKFGWESSAMAFAAALLLAPTPAFAAGFCGPTKGGDVLLCALATDTCLGGWCVPKAKLCTSTSSCAAWQKCDKSCPWTGNMTEPDPGPPKPGGTDAGSGEAPPPSTDASGAPQPPPQDAGSSDKKMPPPDASDPPPPIPADGGTSSSDATQPPPANCPQDKGICLADPPKVPLQPGCQDLCMALVACEKVFGGTSGSGGGSTPGGAGSADAGSSGGGVPPKSPDAGSTDASAGFAPKADTSGDEDKAPPPESDAGLWAPDTTSNETSTGTDPDDMKLCLTMCSIWKLENVAPPELKALEQCVAANKASCEKLTAECTDEAKSFMDQAAKDDSWALALGMPVKGTSGGEPPKGGDASVPVGADAEMGDALASADGGQNSGGNADAASADSNTGTSASDAGATDTGIKADSGTSTGAAGAAPKPASSSGCMAGPSMGSQAGIGLMLLGLALVVLRRRILAV